MQTKQYFKLTKKVLTAVLILSFLFTFHSGQSLSTAHAVGTIRYAVPGGVTSGACNSWGNACELRFVLSSVAVTGDQIWVKAGTYKPTAGTDRSISFVLTNGIALYGGFNGTETQLSQRNPASNITSLSGEIGDAGTSDNSYHVVIGSGTNNTAVLDGFTITAGNATNDKGGGMWNYVGSPTLTNLIFNANSARYGGGMYNENNSNPVLTNVTFSANIAFMSGLWNDAMGGGMYNNSSNPTLVNAEFIGNFITDNFGITRSGGGMYNINSNPSLTNVIFSGNRSFDVQNDGGGGAISNYNSSPNLTNVTFTSNTARYGGGMSNSGNCNPILRNVTFSGNSATFGGAIDVDTSGDIPNTAMLLTDVTFNNNTADRGGGMSVRGNAVLDNVFFNSNHANGNTGWDGGGGVYNYGNLTLANVTFNSNSAYNDGGGIYSKGEATSKLTNVTFINNTATYNGGGMYNGYGNSSPLASVIFNSNIAQNGGGIYNESSATMTDASFVGNTATNNGGGIYNNFNESAMSNMTFDSNTAQSGGGIYNDLSNGTLKNVTISGNTANIGGGMYNENSDPALTNLTFSGNAATISTGGIYNTNSHPNISNSIFWNDGSEIYNNSSTPTISDSIVMGGCPSGSTCTHIINSNPLLGPLQNNGGFTQTMALGGSSPAIDTGNDLTCAITDQRGIDRPQGIHCDIGAYEYAPNAKNFRVEVGNTQQGSYWLSSSQSKRLKYSGLNDGPAIIESLSGSPLVASQRVIYGGGSYSEMMGLPAEQLTKEYLFPYYNNVAMDSQLRISNVGGADTTITVYLGMNQIDQYTLAAGGATRKNYTGRNGGPLRVTSSASDILTTIRVLYGGRSYSELMGLPVEQLTKEYLFPYYNNVAMDSQLRVSNVGGAPTTITVYLGTSQIDSYTLAAGGASRKNYSGKNSGPLRVTSSASDILTTIRVLYAGSSLSELMGFPANQLSQSYWYPIYDNAALDSQLRVSNVGSTTTHITVYAGGVPIDNYDLGKGAAVRRNYPKNTGPLQVVSSTQPILTTIRLLYGTSYYEMTGLPQSQLSTQYFFPWYNNNAMDSALSIAVP